MCVLGICLYLVWIYLTSGCEISSRLEIICSAPRNARHAIGALRSKVDGQPGDRLIQSRGVCWVGGGLWGEKLVSQQSLLNEVN